ncbi:hypothetical protein M405DRAFT_812867, partial [Rhizopogon salebrosus TDB-379]
MSSLGYYGGVGRASGSTAWYNRCALAYLDRITSCMLLGIDFCSSKLSLTSSRPLVCFLSLRLLCIDTTVITLTLLD